MSEEWFLATTLLARSGRPLHQRLRSTSVRLVHTDEGLGEEKRHDRYAPSDGPVPLACH